MQNAHGVEVLLLGPGALTIAAANQYIPTGTVLTATLASPANPPATYQWYRGATFGGGGAWAAIGGATSATYTTIAADTGYDMVCKATNPVGTSTSNTLIAEIDVTAPVLAWTIVVGNSPTITPGTWTDGAVLVYDLYRDGVVTSTIDRTLAQANAYVAIGADQGAVLKWREKDVAAGLSVDTNAVQSVPVAPVISLVDGAITWSAVPNATSYQLYRSGVLVGTITSGYLCLRADCSPVANVSPPLAVKAVNGAGSSAASNAVAYTPACETASLIEGWDALTAGLAPGAISSWAGVLGTVATLTGTTRVYSATSIVDDEGGAHPGVHFVTDLMTCPIGALIAGKTRVGLVIGWQHVQTQLEVIAELGTSYSGANGQWGLLGNVLGVTKFDLYTATKGGGGIGSWQLPAYTIGNDPCSVTAVFDLASASIGSTAWRVDNVDIPGGVTGADGAHLVAGSTMPNVNFYFGARASAAFPFQGYLNGLWLFNNPSAAVLSRADWYSSGAVGEVAA